jgi:hypothetical protein
MPKPRKKPAKPVSLHPLEPEDALAGLMQVQPKPEKEEAPADERQEQESESEDANAS